jgi:hypothetical protein
MEWIKFEIQEYNPHIIPKAPFDDIPFIACIWGEQVAVAIYARHYDATNRTPGKYEFFYVSSDPELEGSQIRIEEKPFPITHWMPLPNPPNKE